MLTDTQTPTILLVEDSDDDAFFFRRTLEKSGVTCQVHHVTNGAEAVDFLLEASKLGKEKLPHAIFLDLKMPILNGFEVLDWMRAQTFPGPMQVIVLSGSDHEDDKKRASQLGASDYLVKPIKISDLHHLLRHVCPPQLGACA